MTNSPNWNQFVGQPMAAPPGTFGQPVTPPAPPAPGAPMFAQPSQAAPQQPPGFAPAGYPPAAPQAAPGYAQPQVPAQPGPAAFGYPPSAPAYPPGYPTQGAPGQHPGYPPQAMGPETAGGNVFGAGAFAGAQPMGGRQDAAPGTYVCEIVESGQFQPKDRSGRKWKCKFKVLHAFEANGSPAGTEFAEAEGLASELERDYAAATMLAISTAAFGFTDHNQLKAHLQTLVPQGAHGWGAFSDAIQSATVQQSQFFPPNPLAGKRLLVRCVMGAPVSKGKHMGKQFPEYSYAPAPTGG